MTQTRLFTLEEVAMTRGHTGECGLCCPCHSAAGGQRRALGTGMGQLWRSAIASPLQMALGCHSLNNPCPTAHSTVTLLQHSHSILSPAESTLSSPRDTGVPRAQRHARSITQNETTTSEKRDSQGRKTDVFLPGIHPNAHWWGCTGCLPSALHTVNAGGSQLL